MATVEEKEKHRQIVKELQKIESLYDEKLEKIQTEVVDDLTWEAHELSVENRANPTKYQRYVNHWMNEKRILKKLKRSLDKTISDIRYSIRINDNVRHGTESEMMSAVKRNIYYTMARLRYDNQQVIVDELEHAVEAFRQRGFAIKNQISILEMDFKNQVY